MKRVSGWFHLSGEGIEVGFQVRWVALIAFVKALVVTTIIIAALLTHPVFIQAVRQLMQLVAWMFGM